MIFVWIVVGVTVVSWLAAAWAWTSKVSTWLRGIAVGAAAGCTTFLLFLFLALAGGYGGMVFFFLGCFVGPSVGIAVGIWTEHRLQQKAGGATLPG